MLDYKLIREKMETHRDELCEMLAELVKIPSVQSEARPNAPFGEECAALLKKVEGICRDEGFSTVLNEADGYLLAKLGDGKKIGIFAHGDVVPVGEGWTLTKPFEPRIIDGFMVGRGSGDNKAGIVNALFALKTLRELGHAPECGITLFVGTNEESGMEDIDAYVKQNEAPTVNIIPDCGYPAGRGEKGIMRFYAVGRKALTDVKEFSGGEAFNIILGKAVAKLNIPEKLEFPDYVGMSTESDGKTLTIISEGVSKHAASPEGSKNAAEDLALAISKCPSVCEDDRKIMKCIAYMLSSYYGEPFEIQHIDPDFGNLTCANGIVGLRNGHPIVSFDVRYGASVDHDKLEENIAKNLDKLGFDLELVNDRPGFVIDRDDKWLNAVVDAYRECSLDTSAEPVLNGGGTYARYLKNGISVGDSVKRRPPFELPAGHGGAHQPDEVVSIDGILDSASILAYTILKLEGLE